VHALNGKWKRSSFCDSSACLEVALIGSSVGVQDSKFENGKVLLFTPTAWTDFIDAARAGEFRR
jgi:Domain of unknown function (DUF397)